MWAQIHLPEIKSCMVYLLSQPGSPYAASCDMCAVITCWLQGYLGLGEQEELSCSQVQCRLCGCVTRESRQVHCTGTGSRDLCWEVSSVSPPQGTEVPSWEKGLVYEQDEDAFPLTLWDSWSEPGVSSEA